MRLLIQTTMALPSMAASRSFDFLTTFVLSESEICDQAPISGGSPGAVIRGRVERMLRGMHILTFGGGTNEMQRDLIAIFGLGMPGSPR